eukprot:CAMPEP_0197538902 /NCGR_PEP_ID=MMETSP1318-20131121/60952_1 /TAXON_ID=552666 /ORGANISM="Partenskyella glossopodia, Strain RCC365" /LENGTH=402 /DNA_ID=CAMNT_0043097447 /DNA_START=23 /DNA_END=1231 /DNA_ORIENTATION=-
MNVGETCESKDYPEFSYTTYVNNRDDYVCPMMAPPDDELMNPMRNNPPPLDGTPSPLNVSGSGVGNSECMSAIMEFLMASDGREVGSMVRFHDQVEAIFSIQPGTSLASVAISEKPMGAPVSSFPLAPIDDSSYTWALDLVGDDLQGTLSGSTNMYNFRRVGFKQFQNITRPTWIVESQLEETRIISFLERASLGVEQWTAAAGSEVYAFQSGEDMDSMGPGGQKWSIMDGFIALKDNSSLVLGVENTMSNINGEMFRAAILVDRMDPRAVTFDIPEQPTTAPETTEPMIERQQFTFDLGYDIPTMKHAMVKVHVDGNGSNEFTIQSENQEPKTFQFNYTFPLFTGPKVFCGDREVNVGETCESKGLHEYSYWDYWSRTAMNTCDGMPMTLSQESLLSYFSG